MTNPRSEKLLLAWLLLTLAPLFWGGNSVAGKLATQDWLPYQITCLRWLGVTLLLLPFLFRSLLSEWRALLQAWHIFAFLGVTQAGFNLGMYKSLHYTSALNISILQASMPVWIVVLSFTVTGERVTRLQILGLVLSLVGVVVTATQGNILLLADAGLNIGDLIMLVACFLYAAYTFGLRWRPPLSWGTFLLAMAFGSFLFSLPFALWELTTEALVLPDRDGWLIYLYVVIFASILGQLFFAQGVAMIGGNRAGLFINLVPVFGALLSVLVLQEQFRWFHGLGLVLVLGGIALSERFKA